MTVRTHWPCRRWPGCGRGWGGPGSRSLALGIPCTGAGQDSRTWAETTRGAFPGLCPRVCTCGPPCQAWAPPLQASCLLCPCWHPGDPRSPVPPARERGTGGRSSGAWCPPGLSTASGHCWPNHPFPTTPCPPGGPAVPPSPAAPDHHLPLCPPLPPAPPGGCPPCPLCPVFLQLVGAQPLPAGNTCPAMAPSTPCPATRPAHRRLLGCCTRAVSLRPGSRNTESRGWAGSCPCVLVGVPLWSLVKLLSCPHALGSKHHHWHEHLITCLGPR